MPTRTASTLETYAYPVIGGMLVAEVTMRSILDVLLQPADSQDGQPGKLWYAIDAESGGRHEVYLRLR